MGRSPRGVSEEGAIKERDDGGVITGVTQTGRYSQALDKLTTRRNVDVRMDVYEWLCLLGI